MRSTLLALMLLMLLAGSALAQEETTTEQIIHVGPVETQQSCWGLDESCLVIHDPRDDGLSLQYTVQGFEYEAGYEYQLHVNSIDPNYVPSDGPVRSYELLEVMAKFPAQLEDRVWELQSLGETTVENPSDFTLLFNPDGTVAITSDCNEIMLSEYTANPLSITVAGMTRMFCEGSIEAEFVNALNTARLWTIENGELLMSSDEGLLRFAPANIDGKTWRVQSYESESLNWEDDGSASYTMNFDGATVALMIACNGGSGEVTRSGARIQLNNVMSTLMGCPSDPLAGLFPPADFTYALDSTGQLILNTTDGKFTLVEVEE